MRTGSKHTGSKVAVAWMCLLVFLAVFRDVLANGKPLACMVDGSLRFPALSGVEACAGTACKGCVYAPIPWSPGAWHTNKDAARLPPLSAHPGLEKRFYHLLGTDAQGRDVGASVIAGARTAVMTGALAAGLSLLLGITLGAIAGFWGDQRLRVRRASIAAGLLAGCTAWLISSTWVPANGPIYIGYALCIALSLLFLRITRRGSFFEKKVAIPADVLIMRAAEVLDSIPRIILVIAILALMQAQSIWVLVGLIGMLGWTGIAPILRAELLRIRALPYMEAAEGSGLSDWRLLGKHALPNALPAVFLTASMSVSAAILLEASLMFLGYGGPEGSAHSWGGMLSAARQYPSDWWVALFPGAMIACTMMSLYKLRNYNAPRT